VDTGNQRLVEFMPGSVNFGYVAVGASSGVLGMNFSVPAGTTVSGFSFFATGGATSEFVDGGSSTCKVQKYTTATNCVLNVKFKPAAPGLRRGGMVISDGSGNALGSWLLFGIGTGPQTGFSSALVKAGSSAPNLSGANHRQVDGAGNLFVASSYDSKEEFNSGSVIEYPKTASGYGAPVVVASNINEVQDIFLDGSGNLFLISDKNAKGDDNSGAVLACAKTAKGWGAVQTVVSGLNYPEGLAMDENRDIFLAMPGDGTIVEVPRLSSSFGAPIVLASGLGVPNSLTLDAEGNIFFTVNENENTDPDSGSLMVLPKRGLGWGQPVTLVGGHSYPTGVALDADGDVLVAISTDSDDENNAGSIVVVPFTGRGYG